MANTGLVYAHKADLAEPVERGSIFVYFARNRVGKVV